MNASNSGFAELWWGGEGGAILLDYGIGNVEGRLAEAETAVKPRIVVVELVVHLMVLELLKFSLLIVRSPMGSLSRKQTWRASQ
jgi:hypothetical protein